MTCNGKVIITMSDKEKTVGLTYVQLSRCTEIENLCIGQAVTLQRLTYDIAKSRPLQQRLQEETRLKQLWEATRIFCNFHT